MKIIDLKIYIKNEHEIKIVQQLKAKCDNTTQRVVLTNAERELVQYFTELTIQGWEKK